MSRLLSATLFALLVVPARGADAQVAPEAWSNPATAAVPNVGTTTGCSTRTSGSTT